MSSLRALLLPNPTVDTVTDGVLLARGFHLGSVVHVQTPDGAAVIDTTGGMANAVAARDALREAGGGEARYLVYTHCHPDHCGGAEALASTATEAIVAQQRLPELWERDMGCLWPWHRRVRSWQIGSPEEAGDPPYAGGEGGTGYLEPTLTFDHSLDVELGGLHLHLEHAEGETRDHLLVWIPERGVLCPGDLYYAAFPNLSSPAFGPRPIEGWMRSLERCIELEPEHLVPSHTPAISGRDRVRAVLTTYLDAIRYVWDESYRALNDGIDVDTAARSIRLPESLATLPHLQERYGTVAWGVRAVYDRLTGWHDGDPASVHPLPRAHRDRELIGAAGGPGAIAARARAAHERGEHQLALELASVVLSVEPAYAEANQAVIDACAALARASTSANEKGFYRSGARLARARLEGVSALAG